MRRPIDQVADTRRYPLSLYGAPQTTGATEELSGEPLDEIEIGVPAQRKSPRLQIGDSLRTVGRPSSPEGFLLCVPVVGRSRLTTPDERSRSNETVINRSE